MFFRRIARLYPFTLFGTILFLAAARLLGEAYTTNNIYALSFAVLGLFLLLILGLLSRLQSFRFSDMQIMWDNTRPLVSRIMGSEQLFYAGSRRPFYFFRFHVVLRGTLMAGRKAPLYCYAESSASESGEIRLPIRLPVAGILQARGGLWVRDVFGLTRAPAGHEESRRLVIRPPLFPLQAAENPVSTMSEENVRKRKDADEEKYYMREYIAGDRIKDINWKASVRVSDLITRTSPVSPEQSRLLAVEFRPYKEGDADDYVSILHLNYAKSWLLSFMKIVKTALVSVEFQVFCDGDEQMLRTEEDIDRYAAYLSDVGYRSSSHSRGSGGPLAGGEVFLFTTAYDAGLASYLHSRQGSLFNVYRTSFGKGKKVRRVGFFRSFSLDVLPGLWFLRPARHPPAPAGIKVAGMLQEEPLNVGIQ